MSKKQNKHNKKKASKLKRVRTKSKFPRKKLILIRDDGDKESETYDTVDNKIKEKLSREVLDKATSVSARRQAAYRNKGNENAMELWKSSTSMISTKHKKYGDTVLINDIPLQKYTKETITAFLQWKGYSFGRGGKTKYSIHKTFFNWFYRKEPRVE